MNRRLKRRISIALGGFLAFMIGILLLCMITEASTRTGWVGDKYIHKTKSAMYDKGEPTRNAYRWRGGKLYYYKNDAVQYNAGLLKLTDDNGVEFYIYVRSNGQLATGVYWPTTNNGLLPNKGYDFGTNGRLYL